MISFHQSAGDGEASGGRTRTLGLKVRETNRYPMASEPRRGNDPRSHPYKGQRHPVVWAEMVLGGGLEPPSQGASTLRSTLELPEHGATRWFRSIASALRGRLVSMTLVAL